MLPSAVAHSSANQHSTKRHIRVRKDGNHFHQVIYLQPKFENMLHFPYSLSYADTERQPGKELLNDAE